MASKKKRLADKIMRRVDNLNKLMKEASNMGLMIDAVLDIKQLPFPLLRIRLLKEI